MAELVDAYDSKSCSGNGVGVRFSPEAHYKKEISSVDIDLIDNVQSDLADDGYTKGIRTASKFNRDFIQNKKYKTTLLGGYRGMFDKKVNQILEDEKQYPYEIFYLENKNDI